MLPSFKVAPASAKCTRCGKLPPINRPHQEVVAACSYLLAGGEHRLSRGDILCRGTVKTIEKGGGLRCGVLAVQPPPPVVSDEPAIQDFAKANTTFPLSLRFKEGEGFCAVLQADVYKDLHDGKECNTYWLLKGTSGPVVKHCRRSIAHLKDQKSAARLHVADHKRPYEMRGHCYKCDGPLHQSRRDKHIQSCQGP